MESGVKYRLTRLTRQKGGGVGANMLILADGGGRRDLDPPNFS